jgi:hypothetical protein
VHSNLKRRLAISVVAVAATAFAGGAYAATKDASATGRQAFLNDVARRLHVTPAQLTSALEGAEIDQINAAVASGKLTKAQGNAIKQKIQQGHLPLGAPGLFGVRPAFPPPFAPAGKLRGNAVPPPIAMPAKPGAPVPFGPGPRPVAPLFGPVGGPLAGAASYLGLTRDELLKDLNSGKSLAQIAMAQGKSASGLKAAMIASIKARLDRAAAAKMLTSAQEQQILTATSAKIGYLINRPIPRFGFVRPGSGKAWRPSASGLPPGPASLVPAPSAGPPA